MTDFEPTEKDVAEMSNIELARKFAASWELGPGYENWNFDYAQELVRRAGLEELWKFFDCESLSVVRHAAEKLGVKDKLEKYEPYERPSYLAEMSDSELAKEISDSEVWEPEYLADLAWRAGLWEEWQDADGDTFESVAFKAAEILGVEIL